MQHDKWTTRYRAYQFLILLLQWKGYTACGVRCLFVCNQILRVNSYKCYHLSNLRLNEIYTNNHCIRNQNKIFKLQIKVYFDHVADVNEKNVKTKSNKAASYQNGIQLKLIWRVSIKVTGDFQFGHFKNGWKIARI